MREDERRDVHRDALLVQVHRERRYDLCGIDKVSFGEFEEPDWTNRMEGCQGSQPIRRRRRVGRRWWRVGGQPGDAWDCTRSAIVRKQPKATPLNSHFLQAKLESVRPPNPHGEILEDEDVPLTTF